MFKIIAIAVFACVLFAQYSETAPAIQILPQKEGFVPVYIRIGETPLAEINSELAEAFHESNIRTRQVKIDAPKADETPEEVANPEENKPEENDAKKPEDDNAKAPAKRQVADNSGEKNPQEKEPQPQKPEEMKPEEPEEPPKDAALKDETKPEGSRRRRYADAEEKKDDKQEKGEAVKSPHSGAAAPALPSVPAPAPGPEAAKKPAH